MSKCKQCGKQIKLSQVDWIGDTGLCSECRETQKPTQISKENPTQETQQEFSDTKGIAESAAPILAANKSRVRPLLVVCGTIIALIVGIVLFKKSGDSASSITSADTVRIVSQHVAENYGLTFYEGRNPIRKPMHKKMVMVVIFRDFEPVNPANEKLSYGVNLLDLTLVTGTKTFSDSDSPTADEFLRLQAKGGTELKFDSTPPMYATQCFIRDKVTDDLLQDAKVQGVKTGAAYLLTMDGKYLFIRKVDLAKSNKELSEEWVTVETKQ